MPEARSRFPVVQGSGANSAVTVVYKEFGIKLDFTPVIAGDIIRLKVAPEVSTLDFANGITLQGFRIPALATRRAETNVELRDGQSFAIAGLLDNLTQEDNAAIPILSRVPIIGNLFKSKADRAERTELMVLITPRLVRALEPDEVPPLPTLPRRFLPGVTGEKPSGNGSKPDGPPGSETKGDGTDGVDHAAPRAGHSNPTKCRRCPRFPVDSCLASLARNPVAMAASLTVHRRAKRPRDSSTRRQSGRAAVNRSGTTSKREPCLEFFTSVGRRRVPSLCRSVSLCSC